MTNPKVQAIVADFIQKLSGALAEEGSAAIHTALASLATSTSGAESSAPARRATRGRPPAAAAPAAAAPKKRAKGAKRSPEELEQLTKDVYQYIKKNPGQRAEQIAAGLSITTRELVLPINKLFEAKSLKSAGQRRGTTYTAK